MPPSGQMMCSPFLRELRNNVLTWSGEIAAESEHDMNIPLKQSDFQFEHKIWGQWVGNKAWRDTIKIQASTTLYCKRYMISVCEYQATEPSSKIEQRYIYRQQQLSKAVYTLTKLKFHQAARVTCMLKIQNRDYDTYTRSLVIVRERYYRCLSNQLQKKSPGNYYFRLASMFRCINKYWPQEPQSWWSGSLVDTKLIERTNTHRETSSSGFMSSPAVLY